MIPDEQSNVSPSRGLAEGAIFGSVVSSIHTGVVAGLILPVFQGEPANLSWSVGAFALSAIVSSPVMLTVSLIFGPPILSIVRCHPRQAPVLYACLGGILGFLGFLAISIPTGLFEVLSLATRYDQLTIACMVSIPVCYGATIGFLTGIFRYLPRHKPEVTDY